jgi:hypothetical protein
MLGLKLSGAEPGPIVEKLTAFADVAGTFIHLPSALRC